MTAHRSLREKQRQERENLILQAAEEVLLEKGYHDTSMDEIANRVGIAKGTLYLHFARKEDLIFTFFERQLKSVLSELEQMDAMEGTAQAKLEFLVRTLYQNYSGRNAQLIYMLHNNIDFKFAILNQPDSMLHRISTKVRALLDEGKANGEFDATLPTDIMLNSFFSVLSPRGYKMLVLDRNMNSEEVLHHVARIYFRGIGASLPTEL